MRRLLLIILLLARPGAAFVAFESGPVRPLALSPDGTRLYAANTPDNRLEIFAVSDAGLTHLDSVPVGLEPVAVAARTNSEVWVVNHLSDSVSIVDTLAVPPRVVRTLLVGDEPRDVVFAGPQLDGAFARAFITTARRGQNLPASVPANLSTPGTPRALVWVFVAAALPADGSPETIIELFGDTPRALAATPDGRSVYAAVFHSGNQTTSISEGAVCNGGASAGPCTVDGVQVPGGLPGGLMPGGLPPPNQNVQGIPGPETGLIVRRDPDSGLWLDGLGRNWTNAVRFDLPDRDVFAIDALADPPVETAAYAHVGTILFNMVVDPASGALLVSNTEAHNEVRFEGPGSSASTVRGDLHRARITIIDDGGVTPRHLNKHITALPDGYRTTPMPPPVKAASLATPLEMAIDDAGTLYVAAFGSSAVGRFPVAALRDDTFTPSAASQIAVSGGGPCGLALDAARHRLYVLTRFDDAVKVIDTARGVEIAQHPMHDPEPAAVRDGRAFLYDARLTSSNGEAACASCHVFADFDSLAWDLGNPDDVVRQNFNPRGPIGSNQPFHPLKGPMTTQTLRGMAHGGPMHWRGDRTGAQSPNDPDALDAHLAFEAFNVAFEDLLGRDEGEIPAADMRAFADFILAVQLPPNPVRALDNKLTPAQARGRTLFFGRPTDAVANCDGCHALDPSQGFFGGGGRTTFENEPQEFKVARLSNAYQKIGMFGMPNVPFVNLPPESFQYQGEQVRGVGFLHDGSIATIFDFLHASVFGISEAERHDLEQFIQAFDTTFAPIVGQQVTLAADNATAAGPRIDLLIARARTSFILVDQPGARECDLVVTGVAAGLARGWLLDPVSGRFRSDRAADPTIEAGALRALAQHAGQALTVTCAPPGEGVRLALDRDGDGFFNRDELDAGSDPADPASTPGGPTPTVTATPEISATPAATETAGEPPGTPTATVPILGCPGDCNRDSAITIDELTRGVAIALGTQAIGDCPAFDRNDDGAVTIDELLRAVATALLGCELTPPVV
jgi:DNA-binding beta-propeller fold protein YncE